MSGRLSAHSVTSLDDGRAYTVGSLFSGIGGIDLAFEWAGYETKWQVEIEDFPRQVLERHWPGLLRPRDVRGCTGRSGKGWRRYQRLSRVDILVGGFPCQDISVAGKGAGIRAGTRSGLWFEFARLIGELRPRVVLLENVPAITTRDGTVVIGTLAELGYDAQWGLIRASDAGAPHQRERWFCVAFPQESQRATERPGSGQAAMGTVLDNGPEQRRATVAHASGARLEVGQGVRGYAGAEQPPAERGGRELAHTASAGRRAGLRLQHGQAQGGGIGSDIGWEDWRQPETRAGAATGHRSERRNGATEPGLGGNANGLSARLDGPVYRWPAGRGQPQHAWEPPRVASGIPQRAHRLKALGNAVVPQVVYPLAVAIREWLQAQDADASEDAMKQEAA